MVPLGSGPDSVRCMSSIGTAVMPVVRIDKLVEHLQVTEYVKERITALRQEHEGLYGNISCVRTNAQKYLPNYFRKAQLTKLFFLFPVGFPVQVQPSNTCTPDNVDLLCCLSPLWTHWAWPMPLGSVL